MRELGDDFLKEIASGLTDKLRNSTTVDWQKGESVRGATTEFGANHLEALQVSTV